MTDQHLSPHFILRYMGAIVLIFNFNVVFEKQQHQQQKFAKKKTLERFN